MKNLVLITSIIKTPDIHLSYGIRSIFNYSERFEQTKKTIETIKKWIPNRIIYIIECSELTDEETKYFLQHSDFFFNLYYDKVLRERIYSPYKCLGEGTMTLYALHDILQRNIDFDNLIKISGRYWLSNKFVYEFFLNEMIVVKYINGCIDNVFTALFKLPHDITVLFQRFLEINLQEMYNYIGYEVLFANFLKTMNRDRIFDVKTIGLSGYVSVSGELYDG